MAGAWVDSTAFGRCARMVLAAAGLLVLPAVLFAQGTVLGPYRWQLQPYCNVVTATVVSQGGVYEVDGTDDQCGATRKASVVGLAFPRPDGSIGLGLTTVTAPGATPVHLDVVISLAALGGPWRDSGGNSGTFTFTPGAGTGGAPRPVPPGGIAPGTLTGAHLAAGTIGPAQLAPGAIVGSLATVPSCAAGAALVGYTPSGQPRCASPTPPHSLTIPAPGTTSGSIPAITIGSDGLPVVAHFANGLRVTHCLDDACSGHTSATVDGAGGWWPSIAVGTDDYPIISHKSVSGELRVTHCQNMECSSATTTMVDGLGAQANQTSIRIGTDGLAIVSHGGDGTLRVTHCQNVACGAATSTVADDPATVVGAFSSLAIGTDGLAVISHHDYEQGLRVTHCSNVECTAATTTVVGGGDGTTNSFGLYTSIAIGATGAPIISHSVSAGRLRVTACGSLTCATSSTTTLDATTTPVGTFTSIAIGANGRPLVSHYDQAARALRVTSCADAVCSSGTTTVADDPAVDVGTATSIAIGADGFPIVAHHEATRRALRITKCRSTTCR